MIFVTLDESGNQIRWRDGKRWLWILSVLSPSLPFWAGLALIYTGNPLWALFVLVFNFVGVPIADWWFGEDTNNPPESVVEQLSSDQWYRGLLFASIPVFYASFFMSAYVVGTQDLPLWAWLSLTVAAGVTSGAAQTVGHELGPKHTALDPFGAKVINALTGYGHFCIEHNRGHHVMVATPEDPASARFNESVYRFIGREIPGTAIRGWALERDRLAKKGLSFWHWRNDLLQGYAISLAIAALLIWLFGWIMIPFLLIHHYFGWSQLTFANYVEHYGLKRRKRESGRYEPCAPHHSWNTNHIVSNLMLFHLQRHSDHHANPLRPYQALRNFDELPRLPSGYPGCFMLAMVPSLWFSVMNPKVMEWAGGDMELVNTG